MEIEVRRDLPFNIEEEHVEYFRGSSVFLVKQPKIIKLKQAFIFWNGIVFTKGRVVEESLGSPFLKKKYSPVFLLSCILKSFIKGKFSRLKNSSHLIVHDEWGVNYFHWLTDSLTRLYLAKDLLTTCTLVLPDNYCHSYHHYTLKRFGIENIQWTDSKKVFYVNELFIPVHTDSSSDFNPVLLRSAVSYLLHNHQNSLNRGEKIFISRKKVTATRGILNEPQVIEFLKTQGFSILFTEEFSFEEQVSIFSKAKILISIHGAGLTNLMFMPEGSYVLEFRNGKNTRIANNCYFNLAAVFNQHYLYQPCEPDSDLIEQEANIFVNLDKLKGNLALMD